MAAGLGDILGGISAGAGLVGQFLDRRQQKMASALEKQRAHAALASVVREQGFRELEDPREQAQLRQSLYARGMGKSSIAAQDTARLTDIQARRQAALASQRGLAESGLSLIRRQRKFARRTFPLQMAASLAAGGSAGAKFLEEQKGSPGPSEYPGTA